MAKRLNLVPGLESFFLGFWSSKGVLGAMVLFGFQSYVYIGLGVAFRLILKIIFDTDKNMLPFEIPGSFYP